MSSVVIAGDTSGTVTLAAPSVAGTTTLTLPSNTGNIPVVSGTGTSGQVLTSGGSGAISTWTTISSGGMTLLGTVTATSGNSVSLGSLSLSGYKELHIVTNSVSTSGATAAVYVSSDNSQTANYFASYLRTALVNSGVLIVNLATGAFATNCSSETDPSNGVYLAGKLNITTATTTIYFRLSSTLVYSGSGSFLVYGVA